METTQYFENIDKIENCLICQNSKPKYIYSLGQPICTDCWKYSVSSKKNIPEIDKITSKIFLGNAEAQLDKEILKKIGITNILIIGKELEIHHPDDFIYKHIKVTDFPFENLSRFFEEAIEFIDQSEKVFVHCLMGRSRSASIVIAYLMRVNSWTYDEGFHFVQSKRKIGPNKGFVEQLKKFK